MPTPEQPPWIHADRRRAARGVQGRRIDGNLTQEELAYRAGIDRSTLQRIESGRTEIKLSHLSRIAHVLNVTIAELLA